MAEATRPVRLTVCQLRPGPFDEQGEWGALAEHVLRSRSDLVLLPEMPFGRWLSVERDPDEAAWDEAARQHHSGLEQFVARVPAAVIGTRPLTEEGRRRNRGFVARAGAEGTRLSDWRAKYYLPDEPGYWEASWYQRGDEEFDLREAAGIRCGLQICTEVWFLQRSREYGQIGAQLLAVPRATPRDTTSRWLAAGRVAAVVAGAFCASSNLVEPPGASAADLGGVGWVVDPEGQLLATTSEAAPFLTVEISPIVADRARSGYPRYVPD